MRLLRRTLFAGTLFFLFGTYGVAQEKWLRIESDNGEFSIDFPENYKAYIDDKGFAVGARGSTDKYDLTEMRLVNSYIQGTLLSVETYKGSKGAVKAFIDVDTANRSNVNRSEVKHGTISIKQLEILTEKTRTVRKYIHANDYIYVLTAATRGPETESMRRFFDSMRLSVDKTQLAHPEALRISQMKVTPIALEQDLTYIPSAAKKPSKAPESPTEPGTTPLAIVITPAATYTDAARQADVEGNMRFKLTLSDDGYIPKILVMGKGLPGGLVRQAVFAAVRLKFLPKLKNGTAVAVVVTFEYGFDIR